MTVAGATNGPRHVLIVFANPLHEQDAAFAAWYDEHVADILRLPGFLSARRFLYRPTPSRAEDFKHLAIYEIEGDVDAALAVLRPAVEAGKLKAPDPQLMALPLTSYVFTEIARLDV